MPTSTQAELGRWLESILEIAAWRLTKPTRLFALPFGIGARTIRAARRAPPVRGKGRVHRTSGMKPSVRAEVDADGFGGHTPLFGCVVVQSQRMRDSDDFARLLLDHGADPNARASLLKRLLYVGDEQMHEYRNVTPLSWGERFHEQGFVSRKAMRLIAQRGALA